MRERVVCLKMCVWIKVFRTVDTNGEPEYWETSQEATFDILDGWQIEAYHIVPFGYRGFKQFTSIEFGQYRLEVSQHYHIGLSICACVRLKVNLPRSGLSRFEAKTSIL